MKNLIKFLTILLVFNYQLFAQVPVASFSCTDTIFCEKQCIDFTDLSSNNPTSWQWFFPGADSISSTLQNPTTICYNSYGNFDVTLIACNSSGCDTISYSQFIQQYPNPQDSIWQFNGQLYSQFFNFYQWYEVNSGLIPGATNWNLVPPGPGYYYCIVTNSIGCTAVSNPLVSTGMNNGGSVDSPLKVFPNPFTSTITISLSNQNAKQTSVCVRNVLGQTIFTKNLEPTAKSQQLDLSFLQNGIYFIEIDVDGKRMVKKIVKQ